MRNLLPTVCFACAFALSACGGDDATVLDSNKLETEVSGQYFDQTGQKVKSMSCPAEIDAVKGATATCRLTTTEGNSGDIKVVVLDTEGNVRWDVVAPEGG